MGVNRHRAVEERKLGVSLGEIPVVITGATGRLGGILRRVWGAVPPPGLVPHWAARGEGTGLQWDIPGAPVPALPRGAVVLHLAAVLRGDEAALRRNSAMAAPVMAAAQAAGAVAVLFASTAAVYAPTDRPAGEDTPPAPANPYGRAKLAAEAAFRALPGPPLTVLRIGNVAGADALLAPRPGAHAPNPMLLDPVPGRAGGPLRSWIGPVTLAGALAALCRQAAAGGLPPVLNLAQSPPLTMAGLLQAAGRNWRYGPPNPAVVPAAVMDMARLAARLPLPAATEAGLAAELATLAALDRPPE